MPPGHRVASRLAGWGGETHKCIQHNVKRTVREAWRKCCRGTKERDTDSASKNQGGLHRDGVVELPLG